MIARRWFVLALALVVSGCLSAHRHALPVEEVESFKLASLEGQVAPNLTGTWLSMRDDFIKSKGGAQTSDATTSDQAQNESASQFSQTEFRAFLSGQFSERFRKAFSAPLTDELKGTRPVRVVATLRTVEILPAVARIFMTLAAGQAGNSNAIVVSFEIIDAKSGKVLLTSPPIRHTGVGGQSLIDLGGSGPLFDPDPMTRMLFSLQPQFSEWLFKRGA